MIYNERTFFKCEQRIQKDDMSFLLLLLLLFGGGGGGGNTDDVDDGKHISW